MAKKLIVLTGQDPVRYRDADEGDEQALLLLADGLTSPQVYPEQYGVCAPAAPASVAQISQAIPAPASAPAGVVYSDSGLVTVSPHLLGGNPYLVVQPLPAKPALPVGQVPPSIRFGVGFKVSEAAPGAGASLASVQFGLRSASGTSSLVWAVYNDAGTLKTQAKIATPTLGSVNGNAQAALVANRKYVAYIDARVIDNSGTPAAELAISVFTYANADEPPTAVAQFGAVALTMTEYEELAAIYADPSLVLYSTVDSQGFSVEFDEVWT